MISTTGEVRVNTLATFSCELLHMDTPMLADLQKFTFITFVRTVDAVLEIYHERWPMATNDDKETNKYVFLTLLDEE